MRRDANEGPLVRLARSLGALLVQAGPLDWWMWWRGRWVPVEIKNREGRNRYTDIQVEFLAAAGERGAPVLTWRDESDVLRDLGARVSA